MVAVSTTSCGLAYVEVENDISSSQSSVIVTPTADYLSEWTGEQITAEKARQNGCLFKGTSSIDENNEWDEFYSAVSAGRQAEITICCADEITKISNVRMTASTDYELVILTKTKTDDGFSQSERKITPAFIYEVNNGGILEYYVSDTLLYSRRYVPEDENSDGEIENYVDTPFEAEQYSVSADANITFPYQKTFSDYEDFENYAKKYDDELNLDALTKAMQEYDNDGGFNAHVVFLYGDMAGSEQITYEFLRTVREKNELYIYLKKKIPAKKSGSVAKWQFTVTVPGEYLDEVNPDNIHWVVFEDAETE